MPDTSAYYDIRTRPLAHVESVEDLSRVSWPNEASPAILDNLETDARKAWFEHRRPVFLGRTCPGIFEMPGILCGHEKAWMDMATNPVLAEALLDRFLELKLTYYRAAIARILAAGVEYFIAGESDDLGGQKGPLISPDMYRRLVKPRHTQLFKAIKEYSHGRAFVELHSDGAIMKLIPDLIETGIDILNPIQVSAGGMDDTRELKRMFGDAIVFHGGGVDSQYTLPYGTPQEVKDEVRRRIDDLAPGGGFIFTPVHSIQHDVPFENFMAMLEAYREFG
jgi:uroporphyrinogen decarboxylase